MKLVTLSCPKCSAQLQINEELSHAICNYCGYHFLVDDEAKTIKLQNPRQMGRELEIGRRSVRGGNKDLAQEVYRIKEPLSALSESAIKANTLQKEIKKTESDAHAWLIVGIVLAALFFALSIQLAIEDKSFSGFAAGLLFTAIFSSVPFIISFNKRSMVKQKQISYEKNVSVITEMKEELRGMDIDIIPQAYRYRQAMDFIYQALINQRAMTMQEAVNLYEQEIHNKKMEDLQMLNAQASLINAELNIAHLKTRLR